METSEAKFAAFGNAKGPFKSDAEKHF